MKRSRNDLVLALTCSATLMLALAGEAPAGGLATRPAGPSLVGACQSDFSLGVRLGPSGALAVEGRLEYYLMSTGFLWGTLQPEDAESPPIKVRGHVRGGLVGLTFHLPGDSSAADVPRTLFGTGVSAGSVARCSEPLAGTFAGPREGDIGDWLLHNPMVVRSPVKIAGPCRFAGGVCNCSQTQATCLGAGGTNAFCTTCCETTCLYDPPPPPSPFNQLIDESIAKQ